MNKAFRRKSKLSTEKPVILTSISKGWAVRKFFQTRIAEKLKNDFQTFIKFKRKD